MTPLRRRRWAALSSAVAGLDDDALAGLLRDGRVGQGIGGSHAVLEVQGHRVFAKSVPLTDTERTAPRSTANLFGLPPACQYGVRSPGINAWRELAALEHATARALDGDPVDVAMLLHWRVLPGCDLGVPAELADVDEVVAFFGGDASVARRIEAIAAASWSLVLVLEHVPTTVQDWLASELTSGAEAATAAVDHLDGVLVASLRALNAGGVLHLDAHLGNVLTDGVGLHLADFGLATSPSFDLTAAERRFVAEHDLYDPAYAATRIVNHAVTRLAGVVDPMAPDPAARNAWIAEVADGAPTDPLPSGVAAVVRRRGPVAVILNAFSWRLFEGGEPPPFPRAAVARALAESATPPPSSAGAS